MPSNLFDNMPEALRRENSALYRLSMTSREQKFPQLGTGSLMIPTLSEPNPPIAMMNQRLVSILKTVLSFFLISLINSCYIIVSTGT